ncbi:hypothetical protein FQN50_001852 [Emmonsiellopsis sp. PD_5]|nr:hypothetical protein FQN50_001852 [Emmonsiellopsis sp. PD_5]
MGSPLDIAKTLLIPALLSLAIYLLSTLLILPLIRRYRQRYAQYLPLHTISAHTSTLRDRVSDALMHFVLPSSWRARRRRIFDGGHDDDDDDGDSVGGGGGSVFDDEEGEGMVGFEMDPGRREALERQRGRVGEEERRLSRELEEGFMDDSDEEGEGGR